MKYKQILITGIAGMDGSTLTDYILGNHPDYIIHGLTRWRSKLDNIKHLLNHPRVILHNADILDSTSLNDLISSLKPERIFHLAAISYVPMSWITPIQVLETNIIGTCNLLESVRRFSPESIVQTAGSSEEYGNPPKDRKGKWIIPLDENSPTNPLSQYGISKLAMTKLSQQYFKSYGSKTIVTRCFNHTGPRRTDCFMTSSFAKQIALMEKGLQEPIIKHGDLESERDFTDCRDVVRAYWIATEKCNFGELYVVSSNNHYSARYILDILKSYTKLNIKEELDKQRLRPSDVTILYGNSSKFRKQTGWKQEINIEKTLLDLLNYWRKLI